MKPWIEREAVEHTRGERLRFPVTRAEKALLEGAGRRREKKASEYVREVLVTAFRPRAFERFEPADPTDYSAEVGATLTVDEWRGLVAEAGRLGVSGMALARAVLVAELGALRRAAGGRGDGASTGRAR